MLLADAALFVLRAYRMGVVIHFVDGQSAHIQNVSWSHDDAGDFAEVIAEVVGQAPPTAIRFFRQRNCFIGRAGFRRSDIPVSAERRR